AVDVHSYVEQAATLATNKKSWESLQSSVQSLMVIMPTLLGFALSQALCQHLPLRSTRRFLLEFLLIATPTVCNVTLASDYNAVYCAAAAACLALLLRGKRLTPPSDYIFQLGRRPAVFTLLRSTAYVGTGAAILAVDFKYFPFEYHKSRTYGASIMDMGIGLFVVTMGMVSHRTRHWADISRLPKAVLPMLGLGLLRTLVITAIDYHQDEHEYGKHLNAFVILGLTKLLGSLLSLLARSDQQLLPLGLATLALHELALQLGLSQHIMQDPKRVGFLDANREGFSSLPGAIALYLLSIYCAKWYTSRDLLSSAQFRAKLRQLLLCALLGWTLVAIAAYGCGIARVTFNAGYVVWLLSICATLLLIYAFLFEFALVDTDRVRSKTNKSAGLPVLVECLNLNGLTHFMISNVLTGLVNMSLAPEARGPLQCVLILMCYMLLSSGVVYILFRRGIRIA
ncbi:hypothetical protein KR222_008174, partial [Zaprionus bogoriensis]